MPRPMKDSGVEWLGEIPAHWKISRLKYVGNYVNGYAFKPEQWGDKGKLIIRIQDLTGSNNKPNYYDGEIDQKYYVKKGDILVSWAATLDAFIWNKGEGLLNQHIFKANNNGELVEYNFFFYLLKVAMEYMNNDNKHGIMMQHVTLNVFGNFIVPVPPLDEQQRIATFLDGKCARIDSVIEKTRASIEEYKKLKQSLITRAVTKGIRPARPMKHSGVEWIGDIPSDWKVIKLKYVALFQPSCDTSKLTEETEITYTPMECIKNGYFINNVTTYGNVAKSLTPYNDGDIVLAKVTPCFENGNIAVMENLSSGFGLGSSELFVLRPYSIATRYLFYWLQNNLFMQQGCATMTGTGGLKRVSPYFVKNSFVTYPPLEEQKEIARYLDEKTAAIDLVVGKKNQLVTELERLKKSLIFEYVTGKKAVAI